VKDWSPPAVLYGIFSVDELAIVFSY
jgi:hypothetical protein